MFKQALILSTLAVTALYSVGHAETYIVNGTKDQPKLKAIVALASDPKAKVERCAYKESQDSNEGKILCRAVEMSPRGTLRLAK